MRVCVYVNMVVGVVGLVSSLRWFWLHLCVYVCVCVCKYGCGSCWLGEKAAQIFFGAVCARFSVCEYDYICLEEPVLILAVCTHVCCMKIWLNLWFCEQTTFFQCVCVCVCLRACMFLYV
jgi:hypothetical protein